MPPFSLHSSSPLPSVLPPLPLFFLPPFYLCSIDKYRDTYRNVLIGSLDTKLDPKVSIVHLELAVWCGVVWCVLLCCGVFCCAVVCSVLWCVLLCCVCVFCCVWCVLCAVCVQCSVLWVFCCAVVCSAVLWCVQCSAVLWCGVMWCGVVCAVFCCAVVWCVLCGGRQQLTLLYFFAVRRCDTFVWVRSFERKVLKPSSLLCECSQLQQLQTTQRVPHYPSLPLSLPRTISVPLKEGCSAHQYMSWLDVLSDSLPPILMMRGNQQSVLTFNS